jgi:hypothetical protein
MQGTDKENPNKIEFIVRKTEITLVLGLCLAGGLHALGSLQSCEELC